MRRRCEGLAAIGWAAAFFFGIGGAAGARVIRVPEDYPSVLTGVDAAVLGDSVLVGPGTWTDREVRTVSPWLPPIESTMFLKAGITVIGVAGAEATVLDGGPQGSDWLGTIVQAYNGAEAAEVIGFTVTGGGDGVVASHASPLEVASCRLEHNRWSAVYANWSKVGLTDCVVSSNEGGGDPPYYRPGVSVEDAVVSCRRCTFEQNAGRAVEIIWYQGYNELTLSDCVIRDQPRGGVFARDAILTLERCWFLRASVPSSDVGAGLYADNCSGVVRFCAFVFDSAGGAPGAYIWDHSVMRLESNLFYGCLGRSWAGALAIDGIDGGVRNNIFAWDSGPLGAVIKTGGSSHPDTGCNLFYQNMGGDYGYEWVHAATDLNADPRFCNASALDFTVDKTSPAANGNWVGCGLIGPFPVGCGTVSVEPTTWGHLKALFR